MLGKIAGIGLVALLALALVGGSAYILLRPADAPVLHAARGANPSGGNHEHAGDVYRGPRAREYLQGDWRYPIETWTTVTGTVVALDRDLVIQTGEDEVVVHLGPEWQREIAGLALNPGDRVVVTGFYEDDGFEAASIENVTTGQTITLRDGDYLRPAPHRVGMQGRRAGQNTTLHDGLGRPLQAGRWRGGR